jgi:hypothetical protein
MGMINFFTDFTNFVSLFPLLGHYFQIYLILGVNLKFHVIHSKVHIKCCINVRFIR